MTRLNGSDPASNLKLRGDIIRGLQQDLIHGGHSLGAIPDAIRLIVDKDMWREWVDPVTGKVHAYASFQEFVRAPFTEGLGTDLRTLKNLCRDDAAALDALEEITTGKPGAPKGSKNNPQGVNQHTKAGNGQRIIYDNITHYPPSEYVPPPTGTSTTYALRKLRKDRPDLHQQVLKGALSPHKAMVEAGFRKRTITIPADMDGAMDALIKRFGADAVYEMARQKVGRGSEGSRA